MEPLNSTMTSTTPLEFILPNVTTTTPEPFTVIPYPREVTILAAVAAIIFTIVGIFGNLITILALLQAKKLRISGTTWFVLNLCISDLLFSSINLPITSIRYIHEAWIFGDVLCVIFPFFFYGNVATSLFNMVLIAMNRYILISHYSRYDAIFSRRNLFLMVGGVWALSFLLLLGPLTRLWGQFGLDPPTFSCTILKLEGKSPKKLLFVFGILVPCILIIFSYTMIWFKVKASRRNLQGHDNKGMSKNGTLVSQAKMAKKKKEEGQLTKMMLIIFITFLCCFLPLLICNVADDKVKIPSIHVLASILAWASAVINPIIYAGTNRQYRQAYMELFFRWGLVRQPTVTSKSSRPSNSGARTLTTEMVHIISNGNGLSSSTNAAKG